MSKVIKLKIKKKYLDKIIAGSKTAELRIDDDKNFQVDDYLDLHEVRNYSCSLEPIKPRRYLVKITYVLDCKEIDPTCDPRLKMICFI